MANEAILHEQVTIPSSITVADGAGIEKGTVLKYSDPNTVAASTTDLDIVAGILYTEKISGTGITQAAVVQGPGDLFIMKASGNIAAGDPVGPITGTPNYVRSLAGLPNLSGQRRLGFARETATTQQSLLIELNRGGN